jgi:hypothetical protein
MLGQRPSQVTIHACDECSHRCQPPDGARTRPMTNNPLPAADNADGKSCYPGRKGRLAIKLQQNCHAGKNPEPESVITL